VLLSLHLLTFFLTAMVAHGELARDRPAARHLTEFYLWMSVGGVLGGMVGAGLASRIPVRVMRLALSLWLLAMGVQLCWHALA